jgi:outer membrane protein insertion porin family
LQSLLDLNAFDKTQTRVSTHAGLRGGVVVIFTVVELPLIKEVKFKGLKGVTEADVVKALRERGVKLATGDVYDQAQLRRALEVVRELFAVRGLSGLSVEAYTENLASTHISVEFRITEGRRF